MKINKYTNCKTALILASDSYGLFSQKSVFSNRIEDFFKEENQVSVAYLGFSNENTEEYFELFEYWIQSLEISMPEVRVRWIDSNSDVELDFLRTSNVICLSGGDPVLGYDKMNENNIWNVLGTQIIKPKMLMIGVSAGAIQLGMTIYSEELLRETRPGLQAIKHMVGAHDEANDWNYLRNTRNEVNDSNPGIGIPTGSSLWINPDGTYESFGQAPVEIK